MAWIESHEELAQHPKTRKAARALGVAIPVVVGHLHCLWHRCLSLAEDGDLSDWDDEDIAIAAMWDGDPKEFVAALTDCGMGSRPGFLERDGTFGPPDEERRGTLVLHDWWEYAGRLIARRRKDRDRKREARAADVPPTSDGHPPDSRSRGTEPDPTNPTEPPSDSPSESREWPEDVVNLADLLVQRVAGNGHRTPNTARQLDGWRDAIDKLMRLDGVTPAEVRQVICWATDDEFWKANIRSGGTLRDKFSQLRLRMRNPTGKLPPAQYVGSGGVKG